MQVISAVCKSVTVAPEKIAVTTGDEFFSFAELLRSAQSVSHLLEDKYKHHDHSAAEEVRSDLIGARIGIIARPCAEFVAAVWGSWLNGYVVVPLALNFPEAELLHVITDAQISAILTTPDSVGAVANLVGNSSAELYLLPPVESARGRDEFESPNVGVDELVADVRSRISAVADDAAALIIYTSGTTGRPKGVVHTHAGLGAQVRMISEAWDCTAEDRFLHCLPLHHVHGLINALLTPLYVGATIDLMPKFSTSGVWQRWRHCYPIDGPSAESPITLFTGVPTMYVRLLQGYAAMDAEARKASAHAAKQLRVMLCASSALPEPVMDEWESLTGHRLVERYGMTEFGMGLSNPLHGEKKPGFVGMPLPGIEIRIDDSESDVRGVGELLFKSPSMFREYWRQPQVTHDSFTEDGFFKTGDTVTMKDGYIKILGRSSIDILMVGGFKLSALEIEAVLLDHPAIAECAVFGLPDEEYGEIVCAVVVPPAADVTDSAVDPKPRLSLKLLQTWALERIAAYKVPKKLVIWERMPRNAMGKVNKKEIRKSVLGSPP
ncbi:malonyl-CoA/methylmalonyl-CoA synthetase [Marchantia polymorpha subsp. ruderalis]|uniref:Uncharacterized protein n=2 Tax=Marchantia polymorpha TaxID=3197 RepID=A0AAF6BYY6_MARPO|nr:hypothetical protein MARPO_0003s0295 [Marchantia polymorpha]BBN17220.1 hypothetical protein Mp_7g12870 [Marchantia polymorpha subsp. ruderalis]|eukprot:PTQ49455.1 hypothetical protein MARPO_0003s0295 [Marchantia polymorpha]